jgi:hypothetical protein
LAPYVDRYVDGLGDLWDGQVRQESLDLTAGLFPRTVVDETTVVTAQRGLDLPVVPEPGRRILREEIDELQRTLRARAADGATPSLGFG